ncbi:MAG: hypothetical protein C3F13_15895, partial [Anaerolineales bacterium]
WAAYTTQGELRVIDMETGASTLVGAFPGGAEVDALAFPIGGGDIPWLNENPTSGTIPADGGEQVANVTFDAGVVTQPGTYNGTLQVMSNDPENGKIAILVTMNVNAPPTFGKLEGYVYSLGYCDGEMIPLKGAEVVIEGAIGGTWTVETDATGKYAFWLDEANSPFSVDVTYDGNEAGHMEGVIIVGQQTTTQDFHLRLLQPCVSAEPVRMDAWLLSGSSETQVLALTNEGAVDTPFAIREISGTVSTKAGFSAPAGNSSPLSGVTLEAPVTPSQSTTTGECLVAITVGSDPEQSALRATLDELGYPWVEIDSVLEARNAGAVVIMDHSPATPNLPGTDLQTWMEDGFGYIEQGDWPQYFPDTFSAAASGTPLDIVVMDPSHPIMRGLPASWTGLGFWAYDWFQDAVGYLTNATYPNLAKAGYFGSLNDRAISYVEVGDDGRGVYLGLNVQGSMAGDNEKLLFDNALRWAGHCAVEDVPWLTEDPVEGTLAADSGLDVDVTFTALPTMTLGTYTATLMIDTDDPIVGQQAVTAVLHIVDEFLPPVPEFVATTEVVGTPTRFTNLSFAGIPPAEYTWNFGDGSSQLVVSTIDDVYHTYDRFGTFTVTLKACNGLFPCVSVSHPVVVLPTGTIYLPIVTKK